MADVDLAQLATRKDGTAVVFVGTCGCLVAATTSRALSELSQFVTEHAAWGRPQPWSLERMRRAAPYDNCCQPQALIEQHIATSDPGTPGHDPSTAAHAGALARFIDAVAVELGGGQLPLELPIEGDTPQLDAAWHDLVVGHLAARATAEASCPRCIDQGFDPSGGQACPEPGCAEGEHVRAHERHWATLTPDQRRAELDAMARYSTLQD